MDIMTAITKRGSVRAYKEEQVTEKDLNEILMAGSMAPVGRARYDTLHLTIIQNKEILKKMSPIGNKELDTGSVDITYGAPTLIMISSQKPISEGADYANAATVMQNMMLAAVNIGLGSCPIWSSALAIEATSSLKESCQIPSGFKALCGLALGYPVKEPIEKTLKIKFNINRV